MRVIGAVLIAGQATVSTLVALVLDRDARSWPFDRYPTFTRPLQREIPLWEARAVRADGAEVVLDAWSRSCTRISACHRLRAELVAETDPARRRVRSVALASRLFRHAPAPVRAAAREVAVYEVVVRLEARPVVASERVLDRLAISELSR